MACERLTQARNVFGKGSGLRFSDKRLMRGWQLCLRAHGCIWALNQVEGWIRAGTAAVQRVGTVPRRNPMSDKASYHGCILKTVEDDTNTPLATLGWTLGRQVVPNNLQYSAKVLNSWWPVVNTPARKERGAALHTEVASWSSWRVREW